MLVTLLWLACILDRVVLLEPAIAKRLGRLKHPFQLKHALTIGDYVEQNIAVQDMWSHNFAKRRSLPQLRGRGSVPTCVNKVKPQKYPNK